MKVLNSICCCFQGESARHTIHLAPVVSSLALQLVYHESQPLLIQILGSRQVYPLLDLEPPAMVDPQILAYFRAASWHGVAKSVVRDRLTQQEQQK